MSTFFYSIDLMGKRSVTHTCLTFFLLKKRRITQEMMMMMMIRHTAQSGIVQPSLLRLLICLSRYPLLFLVARPSCAHYHNSDISLFFSSFFFLTPILQHPVSVCKKREKRDFNEFFVSLLCPAHTIHTNSHFLFNVRERKEEKRLIHRSISQYSNNEKTMNRKKRHQ